MLSSPPVAAAIPTAPMGPNSDVADPACARTALDAAQAQVNQLVLGKAAQVRLAFACLLAGGHLLLEDLPGTGKTVLAHGVDPRRFCATDGWLVRAGEGKWGRGSVPAFERQHPEAYAQLQAEARARRAAGDDVCRSERRLGGIRAGESSGLGWLHCQGRV